MTTDSARLLVIHRELPFQNTTDILAIDERGSMVVIEVKRGATPREVIAQVLEYASDVAGWGRQRLDQIATNHFAKHGLSFGSLLEAFSTTFNVSEEEADAIAFNSRQIVVIVAESIEPKVLRAAQWLRGAGVDISCVEYTCYRMAGDEIFLNFEEKVFLQELGAAAAKATAVPTEKGLRYQEFWEEFEQRLAAREKQYPVTSTSLTKHWINLKSSWQGVAIAFAAWDWGTLDGSYGGDIYLKFGKARNKQVYDRLIAHREEIENTYGGDLIWDQSDSQTGIRVRFAVGKGFDVHNKDQWPEVQEAMLAGMDRFLPALEPFMAEALA
jgi:hypothetical protein